MTMQEATIRPATPEKWLAAKERGVANGLQIFNVGGDPATWFVTSGSMNAAGYIVNVTRFGMQPWATCGCVGAQYNEACQHKAIVLDRLGILPTGGN
jgi:hypothetical protein